MLVSKAITALINVPILLAASLCPILGLTWTKFSQSFNFLLNPQMVAGRNVQGTYAPYQHGCIFRPGCS